MQKARVHFEEEGTSLQEIVDMRLYEDMATFAFQVFSIAHHSLGAINALKDGEFGPPNMSPGLDFETLHNMIDDAEAQLSKVNCEDIDGLLDGQVIFKMGDVRWPFTNEDFINVYHAFQINWEISSNFCGPKLYKNCRTFFAFKVHVLSCLIFTVDLTVTRCCQIVSEDFVNFCGLLRIRELYQWLSLTIGSDGCPFSPPPPGF